MGTISGSIDGHDDFELGIPRSVPVSYVAEVPESDYADGLVFLIPGFGGDKDEALMSLTRRHIAAKYNLVAVSVRAHCHFCRPNQVADGISVGLEIDTASLAQIVGTLLLQGDNLDGLTSAETSAIIPFLKSRAPQRFRVKAAISPPGDDYQNFGVLTALDHIMVLHHLFDSDLSFNQSNIVCAGTSHGGYVAQLIHKFAPNTISAVIDSSGYSETMPAFLGFGGDEYIGCDENLDFVCTTRSAWSNKFVSHPNYFGPDEALIRDVTEPRHLETLKGLTVGRSCQFRMIHSTKDKLFSIDLKRRQSELLSEQGFDVVLDEMGADDMDGKFISTLEHGMGIALNKLFDKYYPTLSQFDGTCDRTLKTTLQFDGPHKLYQVQYGAEVGGILASRKGIAAGVSQRNILCG